MNEPIKKINRGFRLHRLIEVKTVGILVLKLVLPTVLLFKYFVVDFISGIIAIFIIYNLFYFLVSKSLSKVEENYKTIKRLFFDRISKSTLDLNVKKYSKNNNTLIIDNEYAIGAKLLGKPIESLSAINQEIELAKRLSFLVNNKYRFKVVSILEKNKNLIIEKDRNDVNYLERKDSLQEYISQDYYIFYTKNAKTLSEIIDLIKSYNDLELIDNTQLSEVMANLYDDFDTNKDIFKYYDIYFLHNIGKHMPRFYHYNAKKLIEYTNQNFVYIADYQPYSIKEAENILNNDIRELKDTRVNKPKESEEESVADLKENMRSLAASLNKSEERIYKYSAYFLIEKGLDENLVKELLKNINTSCGLYFSNINIISKYIFKDRFKINPIKTFDIQSNVLKKDFVNERCLLNDPYGKYLSKANNGHIIFNPFVEGRNRKSFSLQLLGLTGIGKSTLLKLLIHNNFYNNNKTIILDIQAEYKLLTKHLGGEVIDSNNVFINIMEIFINEYLLDDNTNEENKYLLWQKNLEDNVERIISFFKHFIKNENLLTELRTTLYEYYNVIYKASNNDMYCSKDYTLKDFYKFIKHQNESIKSDDTYVSKIKAERKALLELEIQSLVISNSNYFTQKTKLDLNNNLICLDLHQLMDNEDDSILKKAFVRQLYSVVILREMKLNRKLNESQGIGRHNFTKNYDKTRFLAIIIDEEHEILNSDDESFITRLNSYTRLAPKCFTGIWGASHTIDDYNLAAKDSASLKRKTLIDLRTYKIIMKQPKSCEDTYSKYIITNDVESNLTLDHIRNTFKYDSGEFLLAFGSEVYEGYIDVHDDLKPIVYRVKKE